MASITPNDLKTGFSVFYRVKVNLMKQETANKVSLLPFHPKKRDRVAFSSFKKRFY